MNLQEWQKLAEKGTHGGMVHNILADWQREQEEHGYAPPKIEPVMMVCPVAGDNWVCDMFDNGCPAGRPHEMTSDCANKGNALCLPCVPVAKAKGESK